MCFAHLIARLLSEEHGARAVVRARIVKTATHLLELLRYQVVGDALRGPGEPGQHLQLLLQSVELLIGTYECGYLLVGEVRFVLTQHDQRYDHVRQGMPDRV